MYFKKEYFPVNFKQRKSVAKSVTQLSCQFAGDDGQMQDFESQLDILYLYVHSSILGLYAI